MIDLDSVAGSLDIAKALQQIEAHATDQAPGDPSIWPLARALAGCVAARYLAVGKPERIAIVGEAAPYRRIYRAAFPAAEVVHCEGARGREEACASDVVVVADDGALDALWLAAGTHIDLQASHPALETLGARTCSELAALVEGRFAPRQSDEITAFAHSLPPAGSGVLLSYIRHLL
jgi:ornithine cyclodeaminase/alanine dehydrogenase-like protein (mu-crystallin family)